MPRTTLTTAVALLIAITVLSPAAAADPQRLLLSIDELKAQLNDPHLRLLDVRPRDAYNAGHLPGAVHVDLNDWKSLALSERGLHDKAVWSARVGALGITPQTHVVVYGQRPTNATRIWWTLKYLGVKEVALLDGGWPAWKEANGPVTQDEPQVDTADFTPDFQADRLAELDDVRSVLSDRTATVIDTRSAAEHTGTGGPGPRKGRIPGAVHQEWTEFVTSDGRFKPVAQIKSLLAGRGLSAGDTHITHCQTGGRASLNAFAMELAGYGPVKNYYCGWSEWSADEKAPVESTSNP